MEDNKEYIENFMPSKGTFWQRWIPGVCKHLEVRCTHGDEIIDRNGSRCVCMICNMSLNNPLPKICFFTGQAHDDRSD